jgi:hypothetical protein
VERRKQTRRQGDDVDYYRDDYHSDYSDTKEPRC